MPGPAELGVPVTIWPGLPAPVAGHSPAACPGPVTAAAAARAISAFSRPGDLVAAPDGSPAVIEAAAAAGRRVLGLIPAGEHAVAGLPASRRPGGPAAARRPRRSARAGGPRRRAGRPGHHRLPRRRLLLLPEPGGGNDPALVYAACQRVLAPGGVLAVITASRASGGQLADLAGHAVAAARAAGLVYAQHIVLVHAAIDGDHLTPDPAAPLPPAGPAAPRFIPTCWSSPSPEEPSRMTSAHPVPAARPARPARSCLIPALELSVWATAQQDARTQRRGRYLPASTAHPAKMLPAIAATAITRYTKPGDLVADPMCGIGTTLVEAIHLGRDGLGIEYEDRWAAIAAANITHARRQGATGTGRGDRRRRPPAPRPPAARHRRAGGAGGHLPALRSQRARPGPRRAAPRGRRGREVRQPLQPRPGQPRPPRPR